MSRVHQAIRKAERENRREPSTGSAFGRAITQGVRHDATASVVDPPMIQSSLAATETKPVHSETSKEILPILHDTKLAALSSPKSPAAEQYRTLKTKLFQMRKDRQLRSVLVTSAVAADGKTLTALNLALTIAQEIEQRVLLIDCDLRRPSVHKTLGFPKTSGLADFLGQDVASSSVLLRTSIPNLWVIPAGTVPENPAELLNTQKMREFLSSISREFDWVIIDSPPVVPLADAELLSSLVDGTLLVVRACKTPGESVTKAVHALKSGKILGLVFNGIHVSKRAGSYYYYSYGSQQA
jgi:exopolysaccharide/PEP-CTERM locus tyrosine autokinase